MFSGAGKQKKSVVSFRFLGFGEGRLEEAASPMI